MRSEDDAQYFLDTLSPLLQEQLISAIYLGREHIHFTELRKDVEISRFYTDNISKNEYAKIIHDKGCNVTTYLNKIESCSSASGFDLNTL